MLKRLVGWFVLIPLSLILIVFALANRQVISVHLDPLSQANPMFGPFDVPLFVVIYLVLLLGVLMGGTATWFSQNRVRQEKRKWQKEAKRLGQQVDAAKSRRGDLTTIEG